MSRKSRLAVALAGYVLGAVIAAGAVALRLMTTPDTQAPGMYACGDAILFLLAFGVFALPATLLALHTLRDFAITWIVTTSLAVVFAALAIAGSSATIWSSSGGPAPAFINRASMYAIPVLVLAVPLSFVFFASAFVAPTWRTRIAIAIAAILAFGAVVMYLACAGAKA